MNIKKLYFQALYLSITLPLGAFAAAPVVDESQNFAQFEERAAGNNLDNEAEEVPIAQEQERTEASEHNANLLNKVQGLQQEIQELRGQLEVQSNTIKQLSQQQLQFYKDIDARISGAKTEANPKEATADQTSLRIDDTKAEKKQLEINEALFSSTRINPADEQLRYLAAYDMVKEKRFDEALSAMQSFVQRYPRGGYTANAHYWLGELFMVKKNYSQAITQFELVLTNFPSSSKSAACTLKIGYALAAAGKPSEARKRLQEVLKNYPDTPTAQLAAAKLQTMTAT